jgi:hypothetical protein
MTPLSPSAASQRSRVRDACALHKIQTHAEKCGLHRECLCVTLHIDSLSLSLSLTHTHTYSLTHSLTHSHTHPFSPSSQRNPEKQLYCSTLTCGDPVISLSTSPVIRFQCLGVERDMIVQLRSLFTSLDKDGGYDAYHMMMHSATLKDMCLFTVLSIAVADRAPCTYQDCFA